ncbi:MAG: hypothetical protein ACREM3_08505 [Candidatus Rokuibacteriota bacterium]
MLTGKRVLGLAVIGILFASACASSDSRTAGTSASQPAAASPAMTDVRTLSGKWTGWAIGRAGSSTPVEVEINPDGTYVSRMGATTGTGTFKVVGGQIVTSGHLSGPDPSGRTSTATVVEKGGQSVLSGAGRADTGPYNYELKRQN